MDHQAKTDSHQLILTFLLSIIFISTLSGLAASFAEISFEDKGRRSNYVPLSQSIDWNNLIPLSSQSFSSKDDLQNYTSPESGDGTSWTSPLILENYIVEQNASVAGLNFTNFSEYLIIKNCAFRNLYPGYREESYSILFNRSQNIKIMSCYFNSYSGSDSNAVRLEYSSQINITDNYITAYYYGIIAVDSNDFFITHNEMWNQKYEHIQFRNVHNIILENNNLIHTYISSNFGVEAITGWNVSQCFLKSNEVSAEYTEIEFYSSQDISFVQNILPRLKFYITNNINLTENDIDGGISFLFGINSTILDNIIRDSNTGIKFLNSYNFLIEGNTFRFISEYIFDIYYLEEEDDHDYEPIWFDNPNFHEEVIKGNTIILIGRGIFKENLSNIQFQGNFIFFHVGHYFFLVFSLVSGGIFIKFLIIQRKKKQKLKFLNLNLQKNRNHTIEDEEIPGAKAITLMQKHESNITQIVSFQFLILFGLFFSFVYSELFYNGQLVRIMLGLFLNNEYYSDVPLRHFLVNLEILIIGIVLTSFFYRKLRKLQQTPPILQDSPMNLHTKEKQVIWVGMGGLLVIEILMLLLVYFGSYERILLILGMIFTLLFLWNLLLKIYKKDQKIWFVIGILGIGLIIAYCIIRKLIDPNIIRSSHPDEVEFTRKFVFWSFLILGGFGWLGALFHDDELDTSTGEK
ncbi:right-handed parallel beta-helix repeat-containing protein [Candidatus Lokiarchaeum ossiferum]